MIFEKKFLVLLNSKAYQKYEAMGLQDQKRKQAAKEKVSTSEPKLTGTYHAMVLSIKSWKRTSVRYDGDQRFHGSFSASGSKPRVWVTQRAFQD